MSTHKQPRSRPATARTDDEGHDGQTHYADEYFDSDAEEDVADGGAAGTARAKPKVPIPSNDALLYNDQADGRDESWVAKHLLGVHQRAGLPPPRRSDAVLACPACFTQLCFDCQQHEYYHDQFRAMFVRNVRVRRDQVLHYAPNASRRAKQRMDNAIDNATAGQEDKEVFWPAECATCATEVAVMDRDEVYHFFNVITGVPPT